MLARFPFFSLIYISGSLPLDRAQFVIVHMYDFGVLYDQSQSHGEEVYGQDKKDAHLTANMGSHLFSLFQALLPEQFALLLKFIVISLPLKPSYISENGELFFS